MSESFTVMNGIKQGGVLSPVLFAVYTDGLLLRFQKVELGVTWVDTMPVLSPMLMNDINITKYDWFKKNE